MANKSRLNPPQLRNRSIKQRDFKSRMGLNQSSSRLYKTPSSNGSNNGDASVMIRRIETTDDDDENDVSVMQLNQSNLDESMASLGNMSMAGLSEKSVDVVKRVDRSQVSDGTSMYSATEDMVVKGGNTTVDDMNLSMAGLSDMSMSEVEIHRVGNASVI